MPRTSGLRRAVAPGVGEHPDPAHGPTTDDPVLPPADHLDRLIHERLRLAIVSALAANPALSFTDLKRLLKSFEGRMPRTEFRLTPAGRAALLRYLDHMEAIIQATRSVVRGAEL